MKKLAILALALLLGTAVQAQQVRANYRIDGMTHIATTPESISFGNVPGKCNVELVGFPDGSTLYLMYLTVEPSKKASTAAPKGVKMGVNLSNGKLIRLEQIGQYPASSKYTQLKYAIESEDMEKMVRGIKSVDIITGWDPDDYVQGNFANNEFGSLLKRHCENILKASKNTMTTTNPLVGRGANYDYNILLSHLAYKNGDKDDVDLYFVIGTKEQFHIPYDAAVRFTLADGSVIGLLQARDDVNFVLVYPSMEDLNRMIEVGISSLSIDYEGGTLTDTFPVREDGEFTFSDALRHELQLIFYVSSL